MRPSAGGKQRVVIEGVDPQIDGGQFPIKRTVGEAVVVEVDIFADGHDVLRANLLYRTAEESTWNVVPMQALVNDRWRGRFSVSSTGWFYYTFEAWVSHFLSWRRGFQKKRNAGQDISVDMLVGVEIVAQAAKRASNADRECLEDWAEYLRGDAEVDEKLAFCHRGDVVELIDRHCDPETVCRDERELPVVVDRKRAGFSAWYEMFPRSCSSEAGRHGTFRDCLQRLPYVASMGFDVLYLPPVHPIGRTHRKGRNNAPQAGPDDPGSPWAIGAEEGGHKALHPELGTWEDFRELLSRAHGYGLEVALDIAFQCSPDHPWVTEHPEWFRHRPDGTVQYAENPPKKYEDIYPLDFESDDWPALWEELKSVFLFWIEQGVRLFRVDNPHTKPFAFWQWLIREVQADHPDVLFLAEAFTRPKVMYRLAKLGFTQSYTYFAWRNTKEELTDYFTELTQTEVREFFRPNLWPNTPDILTEYLQLGGRPAFMVRLVLAATLSTNYGIYGPAFELCENQPREPGSEEYWESEKYEIKYDDLEAEHTLREFIARVNRIRCNNPALQTNRQLVFHRVDNPELICYSRQTENSENLLVVVVNVDPHHTQSGFVELPLQQLGLDEEHPYQMHDLLTDARYLWHGAWNYVELDPHSGPAHIFRVRRRTRTEQDFEYYF